MQLPLLELRSSTAGTSRIPKNDSDLFLKLGHHSSDVNVMIRRVPKMKEKYIQHIIEYLSYASLNFDYFVSVDVFVYIGDLSEVFRLIKSRNKKGGMLAFSTENYDGDGFFLEQSGRYSHSKQYIEGLCEKFGYELSHFEIQTLRKEKNQNIRGGLYLLNF